MGLSVVNRAERAEPESDERRPAVIWVANLPSTRLALLSLLIPPNLLIFPENPLPHFGRFGRFGSFSSEIQAAVFSKPNGTGTIRNP